MLRTAVPKMIQLGGSISFAPKPSWEAKFPNYDSRHKLAEIDPEPGPCQGDLLELPPAMSSGEADASAA
jgi:hypothetical protein